MGSTVITSEAGLNVFRYFGSSGINQGISLVRVTCLPSSVVNNIHVSSKSKYQL